MSKLEGATYGVVENDDCPLHYWHKGTGPLVFFIPGGNGYGMQFDKMIDAYAETGRYTAATFDRRQMSASQPARAKTFSFFQQARDVRAVIRALGFEKAIVFGSSSGGIISLQFALDYPDVIEHLVVHEAPTALLLPDAVEVYEWQLGLYDTYKTSGPQAAFAEFSKCFIGQTQNEDPRMLLDDVRNGVNFWEHEFMTVTNFLPDVRRLATLGLSIGVMAGERSKDAFYARTTIELARVLGCHRGMVPGHHQGYLAECELFFPAMVDFVETLEKKRTESAAVANPVAA